VVVTAGAFPSAYAPLNSGEFESRGTVDARRVQPGEGTVKVECLEGSETAEGDWVVKDADANTWVVADVFFAKRYEPIDSN
jgi:hypothetical protein